MFRVLSQNGRLFGKCSCYYVASFSFSTFTDELHGKGKEKCISNGGMHNHRQHDDNDDDGDDSDDDGDDDEEKYSGRKRRATSIEHCLHSIEQIGSAPLLVSRFHA